MSQTNMFVDDPEVMFVVDEAYIEFTDYESSISLSENKTKCLISSLAESFNASSG